MKKKKKRMITLRQLRGLGPFGKWENCKKWKLWVNFGVKNIKLGCLVRKKIGDKEKEKRL